MTASGHRQFLEGLFRSAYLSAHPSRILPAYLPRLGHGRRTFVVGAGKAAGAMARVFDERWQGDLSGLVVAPIGQGGSAGRIEIAAATHPVPSKAGLLAARRMLRLVSGLSHDDLVVCLLSGGGSALLPLPAPGLTLADKQATTRALLRSGASIREINIVRKHLSAIKGGRLAAAAFPARIATLAISDVPNDEPGIIAGGPTIGDPSWLAEARTIVETYKLHLLAAVRRHLLDGANETPKPNDPRLTGASFEIIASGQSALEAATTEARARIPNLLMLGDAIEGEAREVARMHAGIARSIARHGSPVEPPALILSGGETSVTVRGSGRGGRNSEFALALALALDGHAGIHALAADTDGIDGNGTNAGAVIDPTTLARARAKGIDPASTLQDNDALTLFEAIGDLVVTGPTETNVNDFRAILVH